jgi:hypothetical protein
LKKLLVIIKILQNITYLTEIIPFFFCLLFFKRINTKEIKVFFIYTIVVALFLIISLPTLNSLNSYYFLIIRIFLLIEFIILSILYISILKSDKSKQFIVLSICLYVVYWIYNFYNSKFSDFDFIPLVVECLFFTLLIVYYFYDLIQHNFTIPLYQLPSFWISVAFLLYFSGNFFLFLYSKSMMNEPGWHNQYTIIYSSITILKNILLCVGIIVNKNLIFYKDTHSIPTNLNLDSFQPFNKSINP